jgi:hypothetical protein
MLRVGEWLPSQIAFLSMIGVVASGVGSLAFLHTYLMAINVTTCICDSMQGNSSDGIKSTISSTSKRKMDGLSIEESSEI